MKAERPRAAFSCIRFEPHKLDAQVLFRLLSAMAQGGNDQPGQYMLEHYKVEEAFKHLNRSPALTLDQKAGLEFAYIEVLARPWGSRDTTASRTSNGTSRRIPSFSFRRSPGPTSARTVPPTPPSSRSRRSESTPWPNAAISCWKPIERIPGHNDLGELEADRLAKWIATVRQSCAELGRADVADICIGKVLSCAPVGQDGVWPCEPVRDVMEEIQSEPMMSGAHTGVYNSRGVHWRGEGGDQERELARKVSQVGQGAPGLAPVRRREAPDGSWPTPTTARRAAKTRRLGSDAGCADLRALYWYVCLPTIGDASINASPTSQERSKELANRTSTARAIWASRVSVR